MPSGDVISMSKPEPWMSILDACAKL